MSKIICYCYNSTEDEIRNDVCRHSGRSLILEKITAEKRQGRCHCTTMHPEGR